VRALPDRDAHSYPVIPRKGGAAAIRTRQFGHAISSKKKKKKKRSDHINTSEQQMNANLLRALASTASSIVAHGASGADSRAALANVVADVVVAAADLAVDSSLVLGAADTFEVGGLSLLAGGRVDGAALGDGDLAVVAGALAADLDFGAGELGLDVLVYAGVLGC
jgi:hypothetical protein